MAFSYSTLLSTFIPDRQFFRYRTTFHVAPHCSNIHWTVSVQWVWDGGDKCHQWHLHLARSVWTSIRALIHQKRSGKYQTELNSEKKKKREKEKKKERRRERETQLFNSVDQNRWDAGSQGTWLQDLLGYLLHSLGRIEWMEHPGNTGQFHLNQEAPGLATIWPRTFSCSSGLQPQAGLNPDCLSTGQVNIRNTTPPKFHFHFCFSIHTRVTIPGWWKTHTAQATLLPAGN